MAVQILAAIVIAAEKLWEAAILVTGVLAVGVIGEKAINAAKDAEDVFDQKDTKACIDCGTTSDKTAASTVHKNESTEGEDGGEDEKSTEGDFEGEEENAPPENKKARTAEPGEKVRTPDSHPDDFKRGEQGKKVNKHTGDIWDKSHTTHNDPAGEWKVGTKKGQPPRKTNKITIGKDGTVIKIDR